MRKENVIKSIISHSSQYRELAKEIWVHPEICFEEYTAVELQKRNLKKSGFQISDIDGMPTAFTASYGSGYPVIGLLGEYDALPGLSQKVLCTKEPVQQGMPGHGCGHNLIGVGCLAAAVAIKEELERSGESGTIKYFGCPAEEGGAGKAHMIEKNVFDGTDICISWHPESVNVLTKNMLLDIQDLTLSFHGESSQNVIKNTLGGNVTFASELVLSAIHQIQSQMNGVGRLGYCITKGAEATNFLPFTLQMKLDIRGNGTDHLNKLVERMKEVAKGAALMTGTKVDIDEGNKYMGELYNEPLADAIYSNMKEIGSADFTEEDLLFAEKMQAVGNAGMKKGYESFYKIPQEDVCSGMHTGVIRQEKIFFQPSSDLGNVSHVVPSAMFFAATVPLGITLHSWQSTAVTGSSLGGSAMVYAAKVLAGTICDMMNDHSIVEAAKVYFENEKK